MASSINSFDPRQILNDQEEVFRLGFEGQQAQIYTSMPGIVSAVDLASNTCTVQPSIMGSVQDQFGNVSYVNLPLLIHVPIIWPRAGGFALTLPLATGNEVLVMFGNRCIDSWWQSGGIQIPLEFRMHDLSDGFAIPGPCSQPNVITNVSATNAELRTLDGTAKISLSPSGQITLLAPGGIIATGDLNVTGTIVASGEITGNNIPLSTHVHTGVTPGPDDTGPPIV